MAELVPLAEMREREQHYLAGFGLEPRYDDVARNPAGKGEV